VTDLTSGPPRPEQGSLQKPVHSAGGLPRGSAVCVGRRAEAHAFGVSVPV